MKPIKNKAKYVIVSPSGEIKSNTIREYKSDCIESFNIAPYTWREAKTLGWKCKKVYLNITEEKL